VLEKQEKLIQGLEAKLADRTEKQALDAAKLAIQDRDSRVNAEAKLAGVELTEAQIDQLQAQVLAILQNVMGQVSPQVNAAAQTLDDGLPEGSELGESAPAPVATAQPPEPVEPPPMAAPDAGAAPVDQVPA
jgi:hypothetical protein